MSKLSPRSAFIEKAEIRNMSVECEKLGGINLAQGVCDTDVPEVVAAAVGKAVRAGANSYTRHDGVARLRHALAAKLGRDNGLKFNPEKEIVVSAGSTGAFYCAAMALLSPGDEVILFEPYYGYHLSTLQAVEAKAVYATLRPPDWNFDPAELESLITPRTRAIMVCTPANPCGKVWTRAELEWLGGFAEKHDLVVFTDEIYEYITYDGHEHISPASIPGLAERSVTIGGYSKTYAVTGWRIGYAACREDWAERIGQLNDLYYVCAPAPLQEAVAAGIEALPPVFYTGLAAEYKAKRDKFCAALGKAGLKPWVPQGAYYVLADASALEGATGKDKAMELLRRTGVASVPGESFYRDGAPECDNMLRFCYAKRQKDIDAACDRLKIIGG
ncbi:MAG: pyridoxal phosphate-dependent aminotransferase [Minisyncoccota bacterium]